MDSVTVTDALRSFAQALRESANALYPGSAVDVAFEAPRRPEFGEYATNAAFTLTKTARRAPQEIASTLVDDLHARSPRVTSLFSSIEPIAGFINLRLSHAIWQEAVARIVREGADFA